MGLDLTCGDIDVRVGSYGFVNILKIYLLETIKNYIIKNNIDDDLPKEIDEIITNGNIDYNKYINIQHKLIFYNLYGFDCFIYHSDCNGIIESYDSKYFIELYDTLEDYFDKDNFHYGPNNTFFLYNIFKYSANSGQDIYYC